MAPFDNTQFGPGAAVDGIRVLIEPLIKPAVSPPLPIGHQRLLVLADHLENVLPEKFYMGTWLCGTTACAAGHAGDIEQFNDAGYRCADFGRPSFNKRYGGRALMAFFGLNMPDAMHIFGEKHRRTPAQEATIIRSFVQASAASNHAEQSQPVRSHPSFVAENVKAGA